MTIEEFKNLKKGNKIRFKAGDSWVRTVVTGNAYYNSDCDEPGWKVDTRNCTLSFNNDIVKEGHWQEETCIGKKEPVISFTTINCNGEQIKWDMELNELCSRYHSGIDIPDGDDTVRHFMIGSKPVCANTFDDIVKLLGIDSVPEPKKPLTSENTIRKVSGLEMYVKGDYVISACKNAFNNKTSYWISKKDHTFAYYAFTPLDNADVKRILSDELWETYISLYEHVLKRLSPAK